MGLTALEGTLVKKEHSPCTGHRLLACLVTGTGLLGALAIAQAAYTFVTLDAPFPGTTTTTALGINNRGHIVGLYVDSQSVLHGFLYQHGRFATLDVPGALGTQARGLNDRRQIVGIFLGDDGATHGSLSQHGHFTTLDVPVPGTTTTTPGGINNYGQIVGSFHDSRGSHGFLYEDGVFPPLDVPFPDTFNTAATGINAHGQIVGIYQSGVPGAPTGLHVFRYEEGVFTPIEVPIGMNPIAYGINTRGQIVGDYVDRTERPTFHGFLATPHEK
jgi:probable HAF family extracellular repeat protein